MLSLQDVFITYVDKLIEHHEILESPLFLPSLVESLKEKHEYFEVPDLETKIQRHDNPLYWLRKDILQIKIFQYKFFQNIILNESNVPEIKISSHFLIIFIRFNHQLLLEQQDQNAHINFPQVLTETELLPFIISIQHKHLHYKHLTSFIAHSYELIKPDDNFIVEHSETSDNRPYTTSNINSEISFDEYDQNILQHDTNQKNLQPNPDDNTGTFQSQQPPRQENKTLDQQQDITLLQKLPDSSDTVTIQMYQNSPM